MAIDVNNPYFRTKVLTASPEELKLLLIDGGIRFLKLGREALGNRNWEGVYTNLSQAKDIVLELMGGLRHEIAPELCARQSSLYTWMIVSITEAGFEKDTKKLDDVIATLEYERETWVMLMEQLVKERAANAGQTPAQTSTQAAKANTATAANPSGQARRPLSICA